MAVFSVLLAVTAVLCAVIYFVGRRHHQYWAKRGVVHDKPTPLFGNLLNIILMKDTIFDYVNGLYYKYPNETVVGFYGFTKPLIVIRDLDVIKDVLIKNFDTFVNRTLHCDEVGDPLGSDIMFSKWDDDWRRVRQKMGVVFTGKKLQDMYPLIDKCGRQLRELCARTTAEGDKEVDMNNFSIRFAVDCITACAFGSEGQAMEKPESSVMLKALGTILHFTFKAGIAANLMFFKRSLYCFVSRLGLGIKFFTKELEDDMYSIVDNAYKQRLQSGERRPDIFDHIVFSTEPEFQGLRKKTGASFQILLGGGETSSTTIFLTLYCLAKYPEVQKKLKTEIQEALDKHGGEVPYDVLNSLEYLDNVVSESLRLLPVLPYLDRIANKDYQVPGTNVVIEKGMTVYIPMWAIQKDPNFYYEPEKFIPERFSKENVDSIPSMAYFPFGSGPRFCFGKRFGLLVVKTFMVNFFKDYEVRFSKNTKDPLDFSKTNFTLTLLNGLPLTVLKSTD